MTLIRFIFGHGWWVLWHFCFYGILALAVLLTLLMFGQDLKRADEKPDLPSPASIMVLMIAAGLGLVTLVDSLIFARVVAMPWWGKIVCSILISAAVAGAMFPLNILLATEQSMYAFAWNVGLSVVVILGNLWILWLAETRHPETIRPGSALASMCTVLAPSVVGLVIGLLKRPTL